MEWSSLWAQPRTTMASLWNHYGPSRPYTLTASLNNCNFLFCECFEQKAVNSMQCIYVSGSLVSSKLILQLIAALSTTLAKCKVAIEAKYMAD